MIIHINAKPPHLMGNKTFNKDEDFEGKKVERNFGTIKKKTFDKCWILTLSVKPGFEIYLLSYTLKCTKFNIWGYFLNSQFCYNIAYDQDNFLEVLNTFNIIMTHFQKLSTYQVEINENTKW